VRSLPPGAPVLERAWRRWDPRGVLFLGLDIQDVPGDPRGFLREFGISYPSVREPGNGIARAYGSTGLPETYFVSGQGRIVGHVLGAISSEQLRRGALAPPRPGRRHRDRWRPPSGPMIRPTSG
jgi:cytochrome c biogenesis protein CcmG, thiol:disulfide interchange protein DsbE